MWAIIESCGEKILTCALRREVDEEQSLALEEHHHEGLEEENTGAPTAAEIRADLQNGYHEVGEYRVTVILAQF